MRSTVNESRLAPIENVFLNPSFERVQPGTGVFRRNVLSYPAVVNSLGWQKRATASSGDPYWEDNRIKVNVTATSGGVWHETFTARGSIVSASAMISAPVGSNARLWIYDSVLATWTQGPQIIGNGEEQLAKIENVAVIPGNTIRLYVRMDTGTGILTVRNACLEYSTVAGSFFYGGSVDDSGLTYTFEGPANASPSLALAQLVEVGRNYMPNPQADPTGTAFSHTGDAGRVTGFGTQNGYNAVFITPVVAGDRVYYTTASASVPAGTYYPRVTVYAPVGVTYQVGLLSFGGANLASGLNRTSYTGTGAWQEHVLPPSDVLTTEGLRLEVRYSGGGGVGTIYVRNWAVTNIPNYIDGYTSTDTDLMPSWVNLPNTGQSVVSGATVSGVGTNGAAIAYRTMTGENSYALKVRMVDIGALRVGVNTAKPMTGEVYTRYSIVSAPFKRGYSVSLRPNYTGTTSSVSLPNFLPGATGILERTVQIVNAINWLTFTTTTVASDVGDFFVIDNALMVNSDYSGPYIDGDQPNSKWMGARFNSTSAGYPV